MTGDLAVARLFGIEIRVSPGWAVLVALITVAGARQATLGDPALPAIVQWGIGIVVALLFLGSVVAHELAHALVARRRGIAVSTVTLGFIGGLAPLAIQAARPRDELVIAVAGPAVSVVLGVGITASGLLLGLLSTGSGAIAGIAAGVVVVGMLSVLLGILSLVPAMPLDGGRAVRALVWARRGDRDRAGAVTARVGRTAGWVILGCGVVLILVDLVPEGLTAMAFGWLLTTGARTIERRLAMEQLLRGMSVADAMDRDVGWVGPHLTVDTFAERFEGPEAVTALPVVQDDVVVGVLGRRRLVRLGRRRFDRTRVADVMAVPPQAPVLAPSDALWDAMELLNDRGLDGLAVAEEGRLAGLLTRAGLASSIRALATRQATGG